MLCQMLYVTRDNKNDRLFAEWAWPGGIQQIVYITLNIVSFKIILMFGF